MSVDLAPRQEFAEAIPGWMHPDDLVVISDLAEEIDRDGVIVEVGSWLGQSTYTWASNSQAAVYAVDLWQWMPKKYDGPGKERVDLAGDPYTQFMTNVGHLKNVVPIRRNSSGGMICGNDYAEMFPDVQAEALACSQRLAGELRLPGHKFWAVRKPGG